MGSSAKCTIEFETPFWREQGLSGFGFSHVGSLGEVHEACSDNKAALFGFFHGKAQDNTENAIKEQMVSLSGADAKQIKTVTKTHMSACVSLSSSIFTRKYFGK